MRCSDISPPSVLNLFLVTRVTNLKPSNNSTHYKPCLSKKYGIGIGIGIGVVPIVVIVYFRECIRFCSKRKC